MLDLLETAITGVRSVLGSTRERAVSVVRTAML